MRNHLSVDEIQALLDAIRDAAPTLERPPNTFRTEELCEALGCREQKALRIINRLLAADRVRPVEIHHRYPTGVERRVRAWQLVR